jgi:hypothetical protein
MDPKTEKQIQKLENLVFLINFLVGVTCGIAILTVILALTK